jgi:hypothetical protein
VVTCKRCACVITCFAIDPQAEHMNAEARPPRDSAQVACPCCGSVYRYVAKDIFVGNRDIMRSADMEASSRKPTVPF